MAKNPENLPTLEELEQMAKRDEASLDVLEGGASSKIEQQPQKYSIFEILDLDEKDLNIDLAKGELAKAKSILQKNYQALKAESDENKLDKEGREHFVALEKVYKRVFSEGSVDEQSSNDALKAMLQENGFNIIENPAGFQEAEISIPAAETLSGIAISEEMEAKVREFGYKLQELKGKQGWLEGEINHLTNRIRRAEDYNDQKEARALRNELRDLQLKTQALKRNIKRILEQQSTEVEKLKKGLHKTKKVQETVSDVLITGETRAEIPVTEEKKEVKETEEKFPERTQLLDTILEIKKEKNWKEQLEKFFRKLVGCKTYRFNKETGEREYLLLDLASVLFKKGESIGEKELLFKIYNQQGRVIGEVPKKISDISYREFKKIKKDEELPASGQKAGYRTDNGEDVEGLFVPEKEVYVVDYEKDGRVYDWDGGIKRDELRRYERGSRVIYAKACPELKIEGKKGKVTQAEYDVAETKKEKPVVKNFDDLYKFLESRNIATDKLRGLVQGAENSLLFESKEKIPDYQNVIDDCIKIVGQLEGLREKDVTAVKELLLLKAKKLEREKKKAPILSVGPKLVKNEEGKYEVHGLTKEENEEIAGRIVKMRQQFMRELKDNKDTEITEQEMIDDFLIPGELWPQIRAILEEDRKKFETLRIERERAREDREIKKARQEIEETEKPSKKEALELTIERKIRKQEREDAEKIIRDWFAGLKDRKRYKAIFDKKGKVVERALENYFDKSRLDSGLTEVAFCRAIVRGYRIDLEYQLGDWSSFFAHTGADVGFPLENGKYVYYTRNQYEDFKEWLEEEAELITVEATEASGGESLASEEIEKKDIEKAMSKVWQGLSEKEKKKMLELDIDSMMGPNFREKYFEEKGDLGEVQMPDYQIAVLINAGYRIDRSKMGLLNLVSRTSKITVPLEGGGTAYLSSQQLLDLSNSLINRKMTRRLMAKQRIVENVTSTERQEHVQEKAPSVEEIYGADEELKNAKSFIDLLSILEKRDDIDGINAAASVVRRIDNLKRMFADFAKTEEIDDIVDFNGQFDLFDDEYPWEVPFSRIEGQLRNELKNIFSESLSSDVRKDRILEIAKKYDLY